MHKFSRFKGKFGNKKVEAHGRSFSSKLEAAVYNHLYLLELAGEIKELKCQVSVYLSPANILYKPDYHFLDAKTDRPIWAEAKGFETPVWRIKRRLWAVFGPGHLWIFKGSDKSFRIHEILKPEVYQSKATIMDMREVMFPGEEEE